MRGAQESEAQEQVVGQHGATQASPFHAAPPPPLRSRRELSKNPTSVSAPPPLRGWRELSQNPTRVSAPPPLRGWRELSQKIYPCKHRPRPYVVGGGTSVLTERLKW